MVKPLHLRAGRTQYQQMHASLTSPLSFANCGTATAKRAKPETNSFARRNHRPDRKHIADMVHIKDRGAGLFRRAGTTGAKRIRIDTMHHKTRDP
ncbi:hypothetical protein [Rhodobacter sp. 24-YEA-8]|uniref:hypothetical protein n=1 Tax=Rhodobacter sp. 24-YEA-8 TaxID=1884310 RepID=UPI00116009E6|nr:hypothetical protein [Rhodobacter sp. 24-YEA-8]